VRNSSWCNRFEGITHGAIRPKHPGAVGHARPAAHRLERFDAFPGRSRGYAALPRELKQQIVHDLPLWSELIAKDAAASGVPYVDTSDDFSARMQEAEHLLTAG